MPKTRIRDGKSLIIILVVCLIPAGCSSSNTSDDHAPTPVISSAPRTALPMPLKPGAEMAWTLAKGERAKLADYKGKVLVLDFYATWCEPCRESIPQLKAIQQNYGPQGMQLVGLNVGGPDDRIKVKAFANELGIQYPLGFPDQAMADMFLADNAVIPQTFVFSRQGEIVKRFVGFDGSTGAELEKTIRGEIERQ